LDERPVEGHTRGGFTQPAQVLAQITEFREWVVQFKIPFVPTAPRFDGNNAGSETTILGEKRRPENIDCLDAVHWDSQPELPGRRICHINPADEQRRAVFAATENSELPLIGAGNAGCQRQDISNIVWTSRRFLDFFAL